MSFRWIVSRKGGQTVVSRFHTAPISVDLAQYKIFCAVYDSGNGGLNANSEKSNAIWMVGCKRILILFWFITAR